MWQQWLGWAVLGAAVVVLAVVAVRLGRRRRRAPARSSAAAEVAITTGQVEVVVDQQRLRVRRRHAAAGAWTPHVELAWAEIRRLYFDTDRNDPAVALYATTTGGRRYLMDAGGLTGDEWADMAAAVASATNRRLHLDPTARHDPRRRHDP